MTDLQHLRELAQKATPFKHWAFSCWDTTGYKRSITPDDSAFIAACSPERILAMLDVCEAAGGLSRGTDWNNGTQAGYYRKPLMEALARLRGANT